MSTKLKPTPFTRRVGELLQAERRRYRMTQEQLAESADLSLKYIGEIERGEANVTLQVLGRLARVLNWNPWWLFGRPAIPISAKVQRLLIRDLRRAKGRLESALSWLKALDPTGLDQTPPTDSGPTSDGEPGAPIPQPGRA